MQHEQQTILEQGLAHLGLQMPSEGLLAYLDLLYKWNHAYNLTAIRDKESMVTRHLLDSLAILPWIQGQHLLDVGCGAGLPGIPVALACPDLQVTLLDSNGKKIRFLQEVKRALSLNNIQLIQMRAESYHPAQPFDTVSSRAFSELKQMIHWTQHLIAPGGIWLAMKGRHPEAELAALDYEYRVEHYQMNGIDGDRCCVIVQNR